MNKAALTINQAWEKIQRYCAYRERCQYEVREKLFGFGLHTDEVDGLTAELITSGFLNEERFARAFCSGKSRIKKWGRNKIKSRLKMLRISEPIIRLGLQEINGDEYFDCLKELAEKKYVAQKGPVWQKRLKTIAYLNGRGFERDLIDEALKEIIV